LAGQVRRRRAIPPRLIEPDQMTAGLRPESQVAIGGGMGMQLPCEAARQLVARGVPTRIVTSAAGYAIDLLVHAGVVSELQFAFCSLDQFGLAPAFRAAVERGELKLIEMDSPVMLAGLRAGACGLPWIPLTDMGNSIAELTPSLFVDGVLHEPGLRAVRSITPDVAYLQASYADSAGNIYYRDTPIVDFLFAAASSRVVVSVEEIRADADVDPAEARIQAFFVDEIVVGRGLGKPGAMTGYYDADGETIARHIGEVRARQEARTGGGS